MAGARVVILIATASIVYLALVFGYLIGVGLFITESGRRDD